MAIADKLVYLNDTKTLLRDAIRRAGHYLPDAATFRSYPYALLPDESSLSLDFVRGEYVAHNWRDGTVSRAGLSNIMTTTRASGGGYFDHLGVYQWAANNTPRIDHDPATLSTSTTSATLAAGSVTLAVTVTYTVGSYVRATYDGSNWMSGRVTASTGSSVTLWVDRVVGSGTYASWTVIRVRGLLIEESRTNLLTHSSDFAGVVWQKTAVTITNNIAVSPDGTSNADKLVADTTNSSHYVRQVFSFTASTRYTFTVFAKAAEKPALGLILPAVAFDGVDQAVGFDLVAKTTTVRSGAPSATIVDVGGGWVKCSITATASASASNAVYAFVYNSASGSSTYTGDGTSGIYIWGAQLEIGAFPTSYIPTTTAQVTRAADIASVNELSPWYNASEGTLVVKSLVSAVSSLANTSAAFTDGTTFNRMILGQYFAVTRILGVGVSNIDQATLSVPAVQTGIPHTFAGAYKLNDFRGVVDGGGVLTDNSGNVPTVNRLNVGALNGTTQNLNGHIESIRYYPRAFSNTELQQVAA